MSQESEHVRRLITDYVFEYLHDDELAVVAECKPGLRTEAKRFWNQRLRSTLGILDDVLFPLPHRRDRLLFLHIHSHIRAIKQGSSDGIGPAPVDEWILDMQTHDNRRHLSQRKFSSQYSRLPERLQWERPFCPQTLDFRPEEFSSGSTRNKLFRVFWEANKGQKDGIIIHDESNHLQFFEHDGVKGCKWTFMPNVLLTYSTRNIMQWALSASSVVKELCEATKPIDTIEVHGDLVMVIFEDDSEPYKYFRLDGELVPSSIVSCIPSKMDDARTGCRWLNFADGTHVIEQLSSNPEKTKFLIIRPDGATVGSFEVDAIQQDCIIYLNRFIAQNRITVYSDTGELLVTKEVARTPSAFVVSADGQLLFK